MFSFLKRLFGGGRKEAPTLANALAEIAESKIGVRESGGANKGAKLQPFFDADWYEPNGPAGPDDGYAWCASFVCWCVMVAIVGREITFRRPRTPSAWGFEDWARKQDSSVHLKKPHNSDIKRGDIVVFKFSHIGIAASKPDKNGYFDTVEGNTNKEGSREGDGVYLKSRPVAAVRSRIRFL